MISFLESPWPALWLGALALALLGVAYHNTREPRLRVAMVGVVGLVMLLQIVQWIIITEREAVALALEDMAVALETNDIERVMALLAPEGDRIRRDAGQYLPGVQISDANIGGDLEVTINRVASPPTARATFTGRISGINRSPAEQSPYDNFVRRFTLLLRQDGDRWLIADYEMGGPH